MVLRTRVSDNFISDRQRNYSDSMPQRQRSSLKPAHKSLLLWHLLLVAYSLRHTRGDCAQTGHQLIDLTHTFDNDTIYWPTEPTLELNVTYNGIFPGTDYWYQKDAIFTATHGGTHLDAPSHFALGKWSVSDIPLRHLIASAVVIDISHHVGDNPDRHLTVDDIQQWENDHGPIPDGSLLLVSTGWARFWPDKAKYGGTIGRDVTQLKFPSIEKQAAEWLVGNRNLVGVGIDTMSVDVPNRRPDVHITLAEKNIYGLENLKDLDLLPATGAVVYVMPMKLRYASGAPCRVVAQFGNSEQASGLRYEGGSGWCVHSNYVIVLMSMLAAFAIARM